MANVASALRKLGADVEVIMTKNATQFITPITFETLTGHKCMVDTFDRDFKFEVTHISLAKKADVILVAPATANIIAKMAHGIADDMLTTVILAAKCPKLVSPAMNTGMLENPITQDNIATLEKYGFTVIPSESGVLACKDVGSGRLPKEEVLLDYIFRVIAKPKDLAGLRIAVTAGPTPGAAGPCALPDQPLHRQDGLCRGPCRRDAGCRSHPHPRPDGPAAGAVHRGCPHHDSPADVRGRDQPLRRDGRSGHGRCRGRLSPRRRGRRQNQEEGRRSLHRRGAAPDILGTIGPKKKGQFLCGFSMETRDMLANSSAKLEKKNLDMVVANNLRSPVPGLAWIPMLSPSSRRTVPANCP